MVDVHGWQELVDGHDRMLDVLGEYPGQALMGEHVTERAVAITGHNEVRGQGKVGLKGEAAEIEKVKRPWG